MATMKSEAGGISWYDCLVLRFSTSTSTSQRVLTKIAHKNMHGAIQGAYKQPLIQLILLDLTQFGEHGSLIGFLNSSFKFGQITCNMLRALLILSLSASK